MILSLEEIAAMVKGELTNGRDAAVRGVSSLDQASEQDISFYADPRFEGALKDSRAGALLTRHKQEAFAGPQILVPNPLLAFARVAACFAPRPSYRGPGIAEGAFIHETSRIGTDVSIHPHAYVGEGAVIGNGVTLFPGVYIGDRVRVGDGTLVYPNVTILRDCRIGKEVILHAGSVIGSDGYGYTPHGEGRVKVPQLGIVQIDDGAEIGANNTIDRATLGKTWIQRGVKTDNLVHIAHNVLIGENALVLAQAAIAGSTRIGRQVIIAGQVGVGDHLEIGDGAIVGPQSGVAKSIPPGEIVSGTTAMSHKLWLRTRGLIPRLPELVKKVRELEKRLKRIEKTPLD